MGLLVHNGSAFHFANSAMYWNGSAWVEPQSIKRHNGSVWEEVYNLPPQYIQSGTLAWTCTSGYQHSFPDAYSIQFYGTFDIMSLGTSWRANVNGISLSGVRCVEVDFVPFSDNTSGQITVSKNYYNDAFSDMEVRSGTVTCSANQVATMQIDVDDLINFYEIGLFIIPPDGTTPTQAKFSNLRLIKK